MNEFNFLEDEEIELMIEASKQRMHKTLNGKMVKIGSKQCHDDIVKRVDDIAYHRNDSGYGSDARSYFSGVLRVLRRKLRENEKVMNSESTPVEKVKKSKAPSKKLKESREFEEQVANRILKLAGIL